jgi:hypothetical protein
MPEYFKVLSTEGKRYLLRCSLDSDWALQIGFDGDKLLARPNTTVVAVDPVKVHSAENQIAGCEQCRRVLSDCTYSVR